MGVGLYDPSSPIRIKVLYNKGPLQIDRYFFRDRLNQATQKRQPHFGTDTNAYRLVFGENDGLPGLIADLYDKTLVVKLYSAIWIPYLELLIEELALVSGATTGILRLSRLLRSETKNDLKEGEVLFGELASEEVQFKEHGVLFSANLVKGHKTGFFLDHRHNRKRVGELARGRSVLDVFSYAGGFSVHALSAGASHVCTVDISGQALEVAKANATLNPHQGSHELIKGDAFEILEHMKAEKSSYELVVIDPPSFAKEKKQIGSALKKYAWLGRTGIALCGKGGVLVMASCSSRIDSNQFFELVINEARNSKRPFTVIDQTRHDVDHPVGFAEGAYLKCIFVRFDD